MKVIIEIENDDELRRVKEVLGEERVEVRRLGDTDREARRRRMRQVLDRIRIDLPDDYRFNREDLYDRHG